LSGRESATSKYRCVDYKNAFIPAQVADNSYNF
jgi:hypothetical protein